MISVLRTGLARPRRTPRDWMMFIAIMGLSGIGDAQERFRSAFNDPPVGWAGPVFELSQAYPTTRPNLEPRSQRRWTQFDFKKPSEAPLYLKAVLDYCLEGNTADNFADVSRNSVRKWYHAPWLHAPSSDGRMDGREFIHGLTKERPSQPPELGPSHTQEHDSWAVGFYNALGGYTIGQVWKDAAHPDPRKASFPWHTVGCKLLFTTAPLPEAPFLDGSLEWEADIHRSQGTESRPKLRLVQFDVAVKDPRASSTTGWVFGTFQYEKAASTSPSWWAHLVPVGLMWGSDVAQLKAKQPAREQWINTARGQKLHLGRGDLVLNGPIDNPRGSCTSCHGFAQIARVNNPLPRLPLRPPAGNASAATLDRYFTNVKAATALSPDYVSVDYSLQMQAGIVRAVAAGQARLPPDLNSTGRGTTRRRPVATRLDEVTRHQQ